MNTRGQPVLKNGIVHPFRYQLRRLLVLPLTFTNREATLSRIIASKGFINIHEITLLLFSDTKMSHLKTSVKHVSNGFDIESVVLSRNLFDG